MQSIWLLLLAVQILDSSAVFTNTRTFHEQLAYGNQLSIRLPTEAEKLDFVPPDVSSNTVLWSRFTLTKKGYVTGKDDNRRFTMSSVTFDDQGTYTVFNFWNQKIYIYLLMVITKRETQNRVAGETLSIYLSGIPSNEATLQFSNDNYNVPLVKHGVLVANSHPDYVGRIKITSNRIEVSNVNVSDVGNYTLSDGLDRKAKIIYMQLVDHHEGVNAGPFMGLLMLLGIPPCIFCCCKKKICRKNSQAAATNMNTTLNMDNQMHPPGSVPPYSNPAAHGGPIPAYTPGCPAVGEATIHPPPNPTFPPQPPYNGYPATSPAMPPNPALNPGYPPAAEFPPAHSPQWSGAPYNQPAAPYNQPAAPYNQPAAPYNQPAAPPSFAPVMYSAPGALAAPEPVKGAVSPTTPLLTPPQPEVLQPPAPYTSPNVLTSSDPAAQFNINMGKESGSNFL